MKILSHENFLLYSTLLTVNSCQNLYCDISIKFKVLNDSTTSSGPPRGSTLPGGGLWWAWSTGGPGTALHADRSLDQSHLVCTLCYIACAKYSTNVPPLRAHGIFLPPSIDVLKENQMDRTSQQWSQPDQVCSTNTCTVHATAYVCLVCMQSACQPGPPGTPPPHPPKLYSSVGVAADYLFLGNSIHKTLSNSPTQSLSLNVPHALKYMVNIYVHKINL